MDYRGKSTRDYSRGLTQISLVSDDDDNEKKKLKD